MNTPWKILSLVIVVSCGKREQELAQCQVSTQTSAALVRCLAVDKNWPAVRAAVEGQRRQQVLDSLARAEAALVAAAWIADSQQHRYEFSQCDAYEQPGRCLINSYGWPASRAQALDDSIWNLAPAKHAKAVERCQLSSSIEYCLTSSYGWPYERASAAGDSLRRSAFLKKGR